ncbi:MAG: S-methyl-5'-thioadenosine phosphorylase [Acidimicrobiales bacterium]|nr:S-methyl-5'-thioadenosine phosphorylase [Acidimicrobiales bacterium]
MAIADIGVFGGSGFYEFLDDVEEVHLDSEYGEPSSPLLVGELEGDGSGRRVAFLPRHGADHSHPPHTINFRANVDVMRQAGVGAIFGPCASGSLHPDVAPGHFVVLDQFVDRTWGRPDTFWESGDPAHLPMADPYHEGLRQVAIEACKNEAVTVHESGTVVVIQGPRFSTRAESHWFSRQGWTVVNMTQYPEVALAKEAGIPYASIALITDYDAGLEDDTDIEPVSQEAVFAVFEQNVAVVRRVLFRAIAAVPDHLLPS